MTKPAPYSKAALNALSDADLRKVAYWQNPPKHLRPWPEMARADQLPPAGDWSIWMLLGGRGSGKTRAGAEWIRAQVKSGFRRIALIAPTYSDAREVMLLGESGLLALGPPNERPSYLPSRRRLEWPNGACGQIFSAEDPDGLRGPQFDCAWADEFCAWAYPEDTLSNLRFALRLGTAPRLVMTTTPRPIPALRSLLKEDRLVISRAKTSDNAANLSPAFLEAINAAYGGTTLGRQELGGELLFDIEGTLWPRALIDQAYCPAVPALSKIIVGVDPCVSTGKSADACGIIVAGRSGIGINSRAFILEDATIEGASPEQWAAAAFACYQRWDADYIVAEINQGGELVRSVFKAVGCTAPVRTVFATRGKSARAEPVAALYEQGRVRHAQQFNKLNDELANLGAVKKAGKRGKSPDRADALVWAVTELLLKDRAKPTLRRL